MNQNETIAPEELQLKAYYQNAYGSHQPPQRPGTHSQLA